MVRGVGIGLAFVPAMSVAFAAMRPDQLSDATPQLNVVQRLGGAIGTAVLAVVLQRSSGAIHTPAKVASAFGTAYTWSLALSALALIPCVLLMRAERPRMRAQEAAAERAAAAGETGVEPLGRLAARERSAGDLLKACDSGPAAAGGANPLCYIRAATRGRPKLVLNPQFAPLKKWRPRDDNDAERVQADVLRVWARGAPFFAFSPEHRIPRAKLHSHLSDGTKVLTRKHPQHRDHGAHRRR